MDLTVTASLDPPFLPRSRTASEHETAARLGNDQARYRAKNTSRVGDTKMEASNRAEESGKRRNFHTDLGSSGRRTKATKITACKRPQTNCRGAWSIPVQQGNEYGRSIQCDGSCGRNSREHGGWAPQASAPGTPAAPIVSENLLELITCAVATGIAPMDAHLKGLQTEVIAMKNPMVWATFESLSVHPAHCWMGWLLSDDRQKGPPRSHLLRPCMSKRDLRAALAPCQRDAFTISHDVVSAVLCKKPGARHSRSDVIRCRNACTAGSPAYGDHCNASARLEFLLGRCFHYQCPLRACLSLTVSPRVPGCSFGSACF